MSKRINIYHFLVKIDACYEAINWARYIPSITQYWNICPYGAWMDYFADALYRYKCLSLENYKKVIKALNQRGTKLTPADRIRNAVPARIIALAAGKYARRYKLYFS